MRKLAILAVSAALSLAILPAVSQAQDKPDSTAPAKQAPPTAAKPAASPLPAASLWPRSDSVATDTSQNKAATTPSTHAATIAPVEGLLDSMRAFPHALMRASNKSNAAAGRFNTRYGKISNARAGKPRPFFTFGQVTTINAA